MKKVLLTIITVLSLYGTFAQTTHTMFYMDAVPQRLSYNPALIPQYRTYFTFLLPSVGVSAYNDFSVEDLLQKSSDGKTYTISPDSEMTFSHFNLALAYELLGVGFLTKHGFINFGVDVKVNTSLTLPYQGLLGLFQDNSINELNVSLDGLELEVLTVSDFYAGYAHILNDDWTFGARLHYLYGVHGSGFLDGGIKSDVEEMTIRLQGQYTLPVEDIDDLANASFSNGFAIDLGAVYHFDEKITLNASLTNIGFLLSDGYQTTVKDSGIVFDGFDPDELSDFDVEDLFKYGESTSETSYVTALSPLLFLGGTYQVIDRLKAGQVFSLNFGNRVDFTSSTSINYNIGRFINSSLAINMANYKPFSLGFGLSFNLSPIQLYLVTDDLISVASLSNIASVRHANIRLGFNWVFKHKEKVRLNVLKETNQQ